MELAGKEEWGIERFALVEKGWGTGKKVAKKRDKAMPNREKGGTFVIGSGRVRYWQRPLPILAAGGKMNGSVR